MFRKDSEAQNFTPTHLTLQNHYECSMELTEGVLTMIKGGSNDTNLQLGEVSSNKRLHGSL